MMCKRSREIENRLHAFLELIETGEYSTPGLVAAPGVSILSISCCVEGLRERGHDIRAIRDADGWRYVLKSPSMTGSGGQPDQLRQEEQRRWRYE
jgi:hypothetical protein